VFRVIQRIRNASPVMSLSPSRATGASRCSFGACCEQAAYECGTHTVGMPRMSVNTSLGSEPPRLGSMWGFCPAVFSIERATNFAQGFSGVHGTVYATRFKRVRESIEAMKEVWTKEKAEYHGEFVNFDPMIARPKRCRNRIRRSMSEALSRKAHGARSAMAMAGFQVAISARSCRNSATWRKRLAAIRPSIEITSFALGEDLDRVKRLNEMGVRERRVRSYPLASICFIIFVHRSTNGSTLSAFSGGNIGTTRVTLDGGEDDFGGFGPDEWLGPVVGSLAADFGADGISRIAHGASRRSRSAVALKTIQDHPRPRKSGSQWTRCWREADSNPRSPIRRIYANDCRRSRAPGEQGVGNWGIC
jgi:hypothetical protein